MVEGTLSAATERRRGPALPAPLAVERGPAEVADSTRSLTEPPAAAARAALSGVNGAGAGDGGRTTGPTHRMRPAQLLSMQAMVGNAAVQRLLNPAIRSPATPGLRSSGAPHLQRFAVADGEGERELPEIPDGPDSVTEVGMAGAAAASGAPSGGASGGSGTGDGDASPSGGGAPFIPAVAAPAIDPPPPLEMAGGTSATPGSAVPESAVPGSAAPESVAPESVVGPGPELAGVTGATVAGMGSGLAGVPVASELGELGGLDPAAGLAGAAGWGPAAEPRAVEDDRYSTGPSPLKVSRDVAVQRLVPEVEVPPAPVIEMPPQPDTAAVDAGPDLQGASAGMEVTGAASGGGGVTAWLVEQATSAFRSLAGSVSGDARSVGTAAGTAFGSTAGGIFGGLSGIASELGSMLGQGFSGLLSGHGNLVKGLIRGAKGTLRSVLRKAAGALSGLQGTIKSTLLRMLQAGSGNPLQAVQDMVRQTIDKAIGGVATAVSDKVAQVAGSVTAVLGQVEALVGSIGPRLQAFVTQAGQTVNAAVTRVQGMVTGFLGTASSLANSLPGPVRSLVESLLARLRAAAAKFAERVKAAAAAAAARISAVITRVTAAVQAVAARAKTALANLVKTVAKNAERVLRMAIDIAVKVASGIRKVTDKIVDVALSAILPTLPKFLFDWAVEKLTPLLVQRIMDAAGIDLSTIGKPDDPGQITAAASALAQQTAAKVPGTVSAGLLDPEGDHVSKGIYASGAWQFKPPFTVNGTIQLTLDFVANYRTNKIAFFISPGWAAGGGVATGTGGVGGDAGVSDAWGTVATFGSDASGKAQDIDNFSGRFFNVGASAGVSVPVEGVPVVVTTGSGIYMSGATGPTSTPGTTTPGTSTPGTTTPGSTTPGTSTPGSTTPGTSTPPVTIPGHPLGTFIVPFANQSSAITNPAGIEQAVDAVRSDVSAHPGGSYSMDVVGRASNRWQSASNDGERRSNNQELSEQRATGVAREAGVRSAGLPMSGPPTHRGVGVDGARGDVKTNDPADRRAEITPSVGPVSTPGTSTPGTSTPGTTTPGTTTPGTTTPGTTTPGTTTPGTTTPGTGVSIGKPTGPLGIWGPQTSGGAPLVGWDSTRTMGVGTSKEPGASASATVGNSYSVMLGDPIALPQWAMHCVRAVVGLYKLMMDVQSASPLGFLRDAAGLFAPLLNVKTDAVADMIVNAVIPIPDEELA